MHKTDIPLANSIAQHNLVSHSYIPHFQAHEQRKEIPRTMEDGMRKYTLPNTKITADNAPRRGLKAARLRAGPMPRALVDIILCEYN